MRHEWIDRGEKYEIIGLPSDDWPALAQLVDGEWLQVQMEEAPARREILRLAKGVKSLNETRLILVARNSDLVHRAEEAEKRAKSLENSETRLVAERWEDRHQDLAERQASLVGAVHAFLSELLPREAWPAEEDAYDVPGWLFRLRSEIRQERAAARREVVDLAERLKAAEAALGDAVEGIAAVGAG